MVRAVGDAAERMREDRLRALRALRFAGRFGFGNEPDTWEAIRASAPHLGRLSMERVKQELDKVMEQVAAPAATIERYREAGIFAALIPALADAPPARFKALDHLAPPGPPRRPERRLLRLAALFVEPGVKPPRTLERDLKALRFSNVEARAALTLAECAAALPLAMLRAPMDDATLRRQVARVGRLMVPGLARLLLARAVAEEAQDAAAARAKETGTNSPRPAGWGPAVALYRRSLRSAWNDPLTLADLAVDGEDLRTAGVPPGRAMGETLARLLDAVLDAPARNTREQLLALVAEWLKMS
jgi:tRNA nucleotidyltransferase (CCA-adding enzyme)